MLNLGKILYILSVVIISLFIIVTQPKMHKQTIITNSAYDFAEITIPTSETKVSQPSISITNQTTKPAAVQVNQYNLQMKPVSVSNNNNIRTEKVKPQTSQIKKQTQSPKVNSTQTNNKQTTIDKNPSQSNQKSEKSEGVIIETTEVPAKIQPVKQLTEQEEIIAWNQWRSRLQNQVMMDSKLSAPIGTIFKFSFTVDKYGNMSNVKVWAEPPMYSDYAVRSIKPVLMSYRNKSILNFPLGTKRIIVNVDGGFRISTATKYSSPSDYNDYEKVKR